ncbi:hypothetical protein BGZ63DRAFT_379261 [Mariannaea sp. PMI_226]|nr:hypothetical protein BGZ63DRAFT_379261 [Mariannaea sp. PMI_226]
MGSANSKLQQTPHLSSSTAERGLPRTLHASYLKSMTKVTCLLSEPNSPEASYAVNLPYGFWGPMIFYDGPTDKDPIMMTVKDEGKWANKFSITLPESPDEGVRSRHEAVKWQTVSKKERYWFGLEVGHWPDRHLDRFEWRRSHGTEVQSVGGTKWGWKLVRLGQNAAQQAAAGREEGFSSDGGEIVAVWADAKGLTLTNIGEFQLRGSGATGELGQSFALMAVSSCLCIWLTMMRLSTTA